MSADVDEDQEIYDECSSFSKPKPPVMAKPARIKGIASRFEKPSTTPDDKPRPATGVNNPALKPMAVVSPNNQSDSSAKKTGTGGWKPPVKPPISPAKVNDAIKTNNNNNSKNLNSDQPNAMNRQKSIPGTNQISKLNIPNAFSQSNDASPNSSSSQGAQNNNGTNEKSPELSQLKSALRPAGGINSKKSTTLTNFYTAKTSLNTANGPKAPAKSPTSSSSAIQDPNIVLSCDKKTFKLKDKTQAIKFPGKLLAKPDKLGHVDLTSIRSSIPPSLPSRLPPRSIKNQAVEVEGELEELYDDVDNTAQPNNIKPRIVSEIKEYTEEEEERDASGGFVEQETYDDADTAPKLPVRSYPPKHSPTFTGGETYDDCATPEGVAEVEGEMEELYEALDEMVPSATSSPTDIKKEEERKREQERKDKKERERKEKEDKEKQKKLEKEKKKEKDLQAKFKISGEEIPIAEGKVSENCKGGKLDLAIKKGESVSILRMLDNPPFKWLAKNSDGRIGYVESKNIEVDTKGIQDIMKGTLQNVKNEALKSMSGEPEETYDDVALLEDPDQDIYEDTQ